MKLFRPTNLACTALAVLAVFSGCSQKPAADVLALVGETEITVADFKLEYERRQASHQALPERQVLLDQLIDRETFLQQARAAGLDKAADVRHACEDILITRLKDTQLTPKISAVAVTSEEIKSAYEKEISHFTQPAKVKLAILFIAASAKLGTNQFAAAEARANDALTKAATLPADTHGFGQIAADFSDDQATRYRGGDAGWFAADGLEDRWPKEILAAGFALKNSGDLSGVLRGTEGFYLVKKLDERASAVTPLEQVRSAIERRLLTAKRAETERQYQTQARAAAKVSVDAALLASVTYPAPNPTQSPPSNLPSVSSP
jgi:parvulin-like peptidyl-prolyl isomerase